MGESGGLYLLSDGYYREVYRQGERESRRGRRKMFLRLERHSGVFRV